MLAPCLLLLCCAAPPPSPAAPRAASKPQVRAAEPARQPAPAAGLESRVVRAALFKNGLAFVRREASVELSAREVQLQPLPAPVHGTFWIAADPSRLELASVVARRSVRRELRPAVSIDELLRANVGRRLTLVFSEKESLTGTVAAMPELEPDEIEPMSRGYYPTPPAGNLLLLETEDGTMALSPAAVMRVAAEGGLEREYERASPAAELSLAWSPQGEGTATLSIQYLVRGLTWVPSYAIDISEEKTALLTAKAEVIDEVEDLEGATLEFVTGFPNLQFAHVADPLALRGDLDAFLAALGQQAAAAGGVMMQQAVFSNVARGELDSAGFPVAGPPGEGAAVEDLFFYERKDVTLARGERGLYPLFTVRVPYEHLYEWEIPDTVGERPDRSEEAPEQEEIWHSLRLTNDTTLPWTTAPAMTMKSGNLLGQDTLSYAAVGARTTVRITRAVDVQGEQTELEIARERGAATFYGNSYDKVTVKGDLRATNHKREPVRLEIRKRIQGEVSKNPQEAQVVALAEGLRRVNPNTRLTWSLPLEPGKTTEISYEYTLFVRP